MIKSKEFTGMDYVQVRSSAVNLLLANRHIRLIRVEDKQGPPYHLKPIPRIITIVYEEF